MDQAKFKSIYYVVFTLSDSKPSHEYAIEVSSTREVLEKPSLTPLPSVPGYFLGIINLRGRVVPVIDLAKRIGLEQTNMEPKQVLIVESGKVVVGLSVGNVSEVVQIQEDEIVKSSEDSYISANIITAGNLTGYKKKFGENIEKLLEEIRKIAKKTPLESGRKIAILNLDKILPTKEEFSLESSP